MDDPLGFEGLPFVRKIGPNEWDGWSVEETGDAAADRETGRHYAVALLRFLEMREEPESFAGVMKAMVKKGRFGEVERAFCNELVRELSPGAGLT